MQNGVLKFAFEIHVHRVLLRIILALTNFTSNRNSVKNFMQGFTQRFNFALKHLHCPFGVQGRFTREARRAEFTDGWMDGWGIKSVLQCSSYFVGIQIRYIPIYKDIRKLSPTFLWVSIFDVKLGVGLKIKKSQKVGDFSSFGVKV